MATSPVGVALPLVSATEPVKVTGEPWVKVSEAVGEVSVTPVAAKVTLFQLVTRTLASMVPRPAAAL